MRVKFFGSFYLDILRGRSCFVLDVKVWNQSFEVVFGGGLDVLHLVKESKEESFPHIHNDKAIFKVSKYLLFSLALVSLQIEV